MSRPIAPPHESLVGIGAFNMALQGLTVASKTLLLLGLARYLAPGDFGVFGLFFVALSLSLHLVGFDFYAFNTRELLGGSLSEAPRRIRDQVVFHGITYLAAFPILLAVFLWEIIPWNIAGYFYLLLLLEHAAQEAQRVLITLHRSRQAAWLQFVRGGLWVYAVLGVMASEPDLRTIQTVLVLWSVGVAFSLVSAGYSLRDLDWSNGFRQSIEWSWIGRGVLVSLPLLGASLAFRGIVSADRFALERYSGTEAVGIYTLYAGVRNGIQGLLDLGVIAVLRPRVVQAYQAGDVVRYRSLMRQMALAVGGIALLLCLAGAVAIWPVLTIVGNPLYGEHLGAYWLLLAVTLFTALADLPHTALYARHRDGAILVSSLGGLIVAVAANVALVPRFGVIGAALATLSAITFVGGLKLAWSVSREATP